MTDFQKFIDELTNLKFEQKGRNLDLSQYHQKGNYQNALIKIQQTALTEILQLEPDQITRHLNRLKKIDERFKKFWDWYLEQMNLQNPYFLMDLGNFFIVEKPFEKSISNETYQNLHDAVMIKQGVLAGFINQVNEIQGNPGTDREPPQKKQQKQIPDLPEIFKSRDYFDTVIARLKNDEFIELNRITGRYKWLKSKGILAGLASKLEKCNRLQNLDKYPDFKINTDKKQDLGRAFCKYFENVDFIEPIDKAFQNNNVTGTHRRNFFWINEV